MEQRKQISLTMAQIIRDRSESGQLVQFEGIWTELTGEGSVKFEVADQKSYLEAILRDVVAENEDLTEISAKNGVAHYYSALSLSETYARILIRKEESSLIAEIVRENSAIYPRPVPLEFFRESPFDFTQEEILDRLRKMGEDAECQDIVQTTTSIGTVFLYSNRHLDSDYASTLAEWFDVGQISNP